MELEKWHARSIREKRIIFGISALLGVFFFVYFILYPLHEKENQLSAQVQYQKELLVWMQAKAPLLKTSHQAGIPPKGNRELFSLLDDEFKRLGAPDKITLTRLNETKVSLNFNEVPFDDLINQLTILWKRDGIDVEEIQINRLEKAGLVEGKAVLVKGN